MTDRLSPETRETLRSAILDAAHNGPDGILHAIEPLIVSIDANARGYAETYPDEFRRGQALRIVREILPDADATDLHSLTSWVLDGFDPWAPRSALSSLGEPLGSGSTPEPVDYVVSHGVNDNGVGGEAYAEGWAAGIREVENRVGFVLHGIDSTTVAGYVIEAIVTGAIASVDREPR